MIVSVHHGRLSSAFRSPSRAVGKVIVDAVPGAHREWDHHTREWLVFGSHVVKAEAALRAAGVEVVEVAS